jgi:biotin transport system substrate-specific component
MKQEITAPVVSWNSTEQLVFRVLGCVVFALLTTIAAHIRIPLPFTPIPMTLQTFIAPLAGGFLGAAWGAGSMLLSVALGIAGVDVFAASSNGLRFLLAPSAGYIVGFFFAAMIVGFARKQNNVILLLALILSHIVILACGVLGLMWNAGMSMPEAFTKGVTPFLPGDILKITASYFLLLSVRLKNR